MSHSPPNLGEGKIYDFEQDTSECAFNISRAVCTPSDKLELMLGKKGSAEKLLSELKDHTSCDTELCVILHEDTEKKLGKAEQQKILSEFFKPPSPANPTDWLSNTNIDDVLTQIEKKYPSFLHIFFHMVDFATYSMHSINLKNLDFPRWIQKKGKTHFGVVINTDDHTRGGTHWFALFGDFSREPFTIEYFNSTGDRPQREVKKWMFETAAKWSKELGKHVEPVCVSSISYQKDGYSCGTYALYYIMSRLAGTDIGFFKAGAISDNIMHKFRAYLFR